MEIDPDPTKSLHQKSDALKSLSNGQIQTSISNLTTSSRTIPSEKDFHFYYNFDQFRHPIDQITLHSNSMLTHVGSGSGSGQFWSNNMAMGFPSEDVDMGAYDWLVNVNDDVFERFDAAMDEFEQARKDEEAKARARTQIDSDGFQLVSGRRKKGEEKGEKVVEREESGVRVAERDKKKVGPKAKVPFHIPTITRPQDEYSILVNNSNQPFQHVWLERGEDGRFIHPLEKLSLLDFVDQNVGSLQPLKPPPLESTPFKLVEEVKDLKELAAKLRGVNEFAVDLEHNQYRSFQGLTCLMQISTRSEDFVVDTLKLRIHIGPYLREVFKDPAKKKVMHGADRDIDWLQRDFGIYVCNLFDTGQASRILQLERNSLEHLLQHFCGVTANKEYQNADWRLRPLPEEMVRYAREDTHYLLYIYDLMRIKLCSECDVAENSNASLLEVYKRSYDICMQLYEKELLTDTSYLYIYGVQGANLNAQQLSVVSGLCQWRDAVAREEDESTGYILPNKVLLEIAKQMPLTANKLKRWVRSKHPYVERNLNAVVSIIRHSVANASPFEVVAEQLKEGNKAPELDAARADFPELHSEEGSDVCPQEDLPLPLQQNTETCNLSTCVSKLASDTLAVAHDNACQGGRIGFNNGSSLGSEFGTMFPEKVAEATVQVLKKPNRGLGALLGSSGSKRKTVFRMDKLEEIKSSMNLPFYSFSQRDQESKKVQNPTLEETMRPSEVLATGSNIVTSTSTSNSEDIILLDSYHSDRKLALSEEPPTEPESSNKLEDVILLDTDSDDEEPAGDLSGDTKHGNAKGNDVPSNTDLVVLEDDGEGDEGDEQPMTLSDLSSSFQKCLQSVNQGQGTQQESVPQFKSFDYEAARKEVKFGDEALREAKNRERESGKSSGKQKGIVKTEESGLPQGRRRQAFPASGNRSATFR